MCDFVVRGLEMWSLLRFFEKVYLMAEGGSRYCAKKSDDSCGDGCDEVAFFPLSLSHHEFILQ